jgi:phosphopantothenoylcysteine decarboxylase/phosphopantothenate--cysteine ligase
MLTGKNIVLGITGSIAAYKACSLIRELVKCGAEVQVVITPTGKEFITPVTLSTLSHRPVISEFFTQSDGTWHSHVDLGLWANLMLIAPCTAGTIAKLAHGVADNMLITTYLSMKAPVFIAPAMDLDMFQHPTTQANLQLLQSFGNHIIQPASGFLASGLEGKGRMEEPQRIVATLKDFFFQAHEQEEVGANHNQEAYDLAGKRVLITAGPTYEKIDPVRFIGNYSSGKMGFAIAEECLRRGADVTLIAGPVALSCSSAIHRINVESSDEMYAAAVSHFTTADAAILCAAVADFQPLHVAEEKIKRHQDDLVIRLRPTHDIAAALGEMKQPHQRLVAFALETHDEEQHAIDKLHRKHADFIVLNSMCNPGTTFISDDNQITIIHQQGKKDYAKKPKVQVAHDIIDELALLL